MNLVAKEFVAARDDEDGVLILSTFAGASRELLEALPVNPYDLSETTGEGGSGMTLGHALRVNSPPRLPYRVPVEHARGC